MLDLLLMLAGIVTTMQPEYADKYWAATCELAEADCSEIEAPLVAAIDTRPGLMGYYFPGTNIIFLTDRCLLDVADRVECEATVVHEMAHYLANELDIHQDDDCANEAFAWDLFNRYVRHRGRWDLQQILWKENYKACLLPKR